MYIVLLTLHALEKSATGLPSLRMNEIDAINDPVQGAIDITLNEYLLSLPGDTVHCPTVTFVLFLHVLHVESQLLLAVTVFPALSQLIML